MGAQTLLAGALQMTELHVSMAIIAAGIIIASAPGPWFWPDLAERLCRFIQIKLKAGVGRIVKRDRP